jgi:hypothetical protein
MLALAVDGALTVVGAVAAASFLSREVIWAEPRYGITMTEVFEMRSAMLNMVLRHILLVQSSDPCLSYSRDSILYLDLALKCRKQCRQQLMDEIRNIKSHKELKQFLKNKNIFPESWSH